MFPGTLCCAFDGETREQAFDDLVAWIERGVRPDGEDMLASNLSRIGLKWTRVLDVGDPTAETAETDQTAEGSRIGTRARK